MDWYPHHISDYDADTLHLTLAEDGAYSRLLRWYYENERALPDDDVALAAICRVGIDEWRSIAPKIRSLFVTRDSRGSHGPVLGHKRCDTIILAQNKKRKDWKKRQEKLRKNNVLDPVTRDTPVSHASRGEERKEKKEEAKASPKEKTPCLCDSDFDRFWSVYPRRGGSNPRKPAFDKLMLKVRQGVDIETVITGAQRYAHLMQISGKIGTSYVAQAVTWINQERWKDDDLPDLGDARPQRQRDPILNELDEIERCYGQPQQPDDDIFH